MTKSLIASLLAAGLTVGLAGCSSLSKRTKAKGTTSATTSSSPFLSSAKKVQDDLNQTETDLGSLESQVRAYK